MPRYRVLELSFINDCLREAEEEVEYDGLPGSNLQPLDAAARKAAKAAEEITDAQALYDEPVGEEAAPVDLI
jgi:hypothetical protein